MRLKQVSWALLCMVSCLVLAGCGPKIYEDGTYKGISPVDDRGFAVAEVTVKSDKITEVKLTEFTGFAVERDFASYEWEPAGEAIEQMPGRFVGRQDASVDVYTGATSSSSKYISAVSFALEKAKKKPAITTQYFNGTFLGRSSVSDEGCGLAFVTIENDSITQVRLTEVVEDGSLRDYATFTYTPVLQAKEKLEKGFVEKNNLEVDVFTGATKSSQTWIEAAANALEMARLK